MALPTMRSSLRASLLYFSSTHFHPPLLVSPFLLLLFSSFFSPFFLVPRFFFYFLSLLSAPLLHLSSFFLTCIRSAGSVCTRSSLTFYFMQRILQACSYVLYRRSLSYLKPGCRDRFWRSGSVRVDSLRSSISRIISMYSEYKWG